MIPDSLLPKCTKTHVKSHRIAYKKSKNRLQAPESAGGRINCYHSFESTVTSCTSNENWTPVPEYSSLL